MPTWVGAVLAFRNVGANIVSIPVDGEGIDVTALDRELDRLREQERSPSSFTPMRTSRIRPAPPCPCGVVRTFSRSLVQRTRSSSKTTPTLTSVRRRAPTHHLFARRQRLGRLHGHPVENYGSRYAAWLAGRSAGAYRAHLRAEGRWCHERVRRARGCRLAAGRLLPHVERLRDVYQRRRDLMLSALRAAHARRARHGPSRMVGSLSG